MRPYVTSRANRESNVYSRKHVKTAIEGSSATPPECSPGSAIRFGDRTAKPSTMWAKRLEHSRMACWRAAARRAA